MTQRGAITVIPRCHFIEAFRRGSMRGSAAAPGSPALAKHPLELATAELAIIPSGKTRDGLFG